MSLQGGAAWLMLLAGGLWSGGILIVAVERTHHWSRMPVEQYAIDFRRTLRRVDSVMPVLAGITLVGAVVYGVEGSGRRATTALGGAVLVAGVIVSSIVIGGSINSRFLRLPEGVVPVDVEQLRARWHLFHCARTILAVAAFGCLAAAVA